MRFLVELRPEEGTRMLPEEAREHLARRLSEDPPHNLDFVAVYPTANPWQPISKGGPERGGMILVRKRLDSDRFDVCTAYYSQGQTWVLGIGGQGGIFSYDEWMRIPE